MKYSIESVNGRWAIQMIDLQYVEYTRNDHNLTDRQDLIRYTVWSIIAMYSEYKLQIDNKLN